MKLLWVLVFVVSCTQATSPTSKVINSPSTDPQSTTSGSSAGSTTGSDLTTTVGSTSGTDSSSTSGSTTGSASSTTGGSTSGTDSSTTSGSTTGSVSTTTGGSTTGSVSTTTGGSTTGSGTTTTGGSTTGSGSTTISAGSGTGVVVTTSGAGAGGDSSDDDDDSDDDDEDTNSSSQNVGQGSEQVVTIPTTSGENITLSGTPGSNQAEVLHNGTNFWVSNPVEKTCYLRLTRTTGDFKVIKVSRAATSNELVIKKNCDAVGFNYCSDKYLRVEVFSGTDSICDLAVELSTEENIYYLSRTHATTGNLFLSTCGNETKCYTNSSLTLFRKTKNKFEFTIQRKDGFLNSKILYRNLNATQSTGPYKNHYLSNMITPFP